METRRRYTFNWKTIAKEICFNCYNGNVKCEAEVTLDEFSSPITKPLKTHKFILTVEDRMVGIKAKYPEHMLPPLMSDADRDFLYEIAKSYLHGVKGQTETFVWRE